MCNWADANYLASLTFEQLPYVRGEVPERHRWCRAESHVYECRPGDWRWRVMGNCDHCCRYTTELLTRFRKRVRRRYADVQVLRVYEDQKNGALHIHLGMVGLPDVLSRRGDRFLKGAWKELGGGFSSFKARKSQGGAALGRYLGKYLAKQHDQRMARGFRRWSRTAGFAPEIRMIPPLPADWTPRPWGDPEAELKHVGWVRPDTGELLATRYWPPPEVTG